MAVAQPANIDLDKLADIPMFDPFIKLYETECAVCHGDELEGAPLGTPLVGIELRHGDSVEEIAKSIADGFPDTGMPGWSETKTADQIWNIALYVAEQRQGTTCGSRTSNRRRYSAQGLRARRDGGRIARNRRGLGRRRAHGNRGPRVWH